MIIRSSDFFCNKTYLPFRQAISEVFAIAHRLSTLRNANRLVVLDDGQIAEMGTHDELLEKKGIYYRLVNMQAEVNKAKAVGDC